VLVYTTRSPGPKKHAGVTMIQRAPDPRAYCVIRPGHQV